jgi:hypothetical protein
MPIVVGACDDQKDARFEFDKNIKSTWIKRKKTTLNREKE